MNIGFDIISDLNLTEDDSFNWEGKSTSLYCIISGNISSDKVIVQDTLGHLSKLYHGVFYIDGSGEYESLVDHHKRVNEITKLCKNYKNVVYLHNNVVVVDSIALVGCNGWYGNYNPVDSIEQIRYEMLYHEDLSYICSTVEKLQLHVDVKKIVMISHSVPDKELYYGEVPELTDDIGLTLALTNDTESKITHWVFGSYKKSVDAIKSGIHYINNSSHRKSPYWAKRFEIEL